MNKSRNRYAFIEEELELRKLRHQLRALRTVTPLGGDLLSVDGRNLVDFCSNDYLGLSRHPYLKERAVEFIERYGSGSTASRLICGNLDCFKDVEKKLADLKGTETSLILSSGYQANVSILPALADRQTLILSDGLNHNSLIKGTLLARCRVIPFHHNDLTHLRSLLLEQSGKNRYSRLLIVTESVFSMDGDQSDIPALSEIAEEFGALLIVDEAHATGVLGKRGMGLTCGEKVDLCIGTFGKACGSFGAYVACSQKIRDYLVNRCSGLIYSTALPPAVLGAIAAALELIPWMDKEREELRAKAEYLRLSLQSLGWSTGNSSTQIVPVIIGEENKTLTVARQLEENGILATAIRPPTVGQGQSRIRLTLSTLHTQEQLQRLLSSLSTCDEQEARGIPA